MSPGWGTEGARLLARFLDAGGDAVPEPAALRRRLTRTPEDWPVRVNDPVQWREFLLSAGVRDGLPLDEVRLPPAEGRNLSPGRLAPRSPLTPAVVQAWVCDAGRRWSSGKRPKAPYVFDRAVPHSPGIEAVTKLDGAARRLLADLVPHGLRTWPQHALTVGVHRPSTQRPRYPDPHTWPTPAGSALRHLPPRCVTGPA